MNLNNTTSDPTKNQSLDASKFSWFAPKTFTLNATNSSELYNSSNILNFKASTSNESRKVTLDKSILYAGANEEDSKNKNAVSVDYHGTNTITLDVKNNSTIYGNINNNWGILNATINQSRIVGNILYSIGSFNDKEASSAKGMLFSNGATLEGSIINQVYQNSNLTPIFTFEDSHMKGNIINSVLNRQEFTNNVTVNFTGTSGKGSSFKGDIGAYSNHTTVNVDASSSFSGSISGGAQANVVFTSGATINITEVTNSNSASTIELGTTSTANINNVVFGGTISGILTKGSQFSGVSVKDSGVSDLQLKDGAIGSGVIGSYGESSSSKVILSTSSASLADAASHFKKKLNPASSIVGGATSSSMISGSVLGGLGSVVGGVTDVVSDTTTTLTDVVSDVVDTATDVVGSAGSLLTGTTPSSTAPSTTPLTLTQDQINTLIPTLKVEDILGYLKASSISAYAGNITTSGGSNNVDFVDSLYVGGGISTSGGKANVTLSFTDGFYNKIKDNAFTKTLIYGEKKELKNFIA